MFSTGYSRFVLQPLDVATWSWLFPLRTIPDYFNQNIYELCIIMFFCHKNGIFNAGHKFKLVISSSKLIKYEYHFLHFGNIGHKCPFKLVNIIRILCYFFQTFQIRNKQQNKKVFTKAVTSIETLH